jgi:hypothetical protein
MTNVAVSNASSTFSINRLYEALDERRRARGLSWQQLALEMGNTSAWTAFRHPPAACPRR